MKKPQKKMKYLCFYENFRNSILFDDKFLRNSVNPPIIQNYQWN